MPKDLSTPEKRKAHNAWVRANYAKNREKILAQNRSYYVDNKEKIIRRARRNQIRRYGITPELYDEMLADQAGVCKICRTKDPKRKNSYTFCIDHATGAIRGLLCHKCNSMLGQALDKEDILVAGAEYLKNARLEKPIAFCKKGYIL